MKKFITLITVLLLLFSITLTGCGGEEAPADTTDPGVEQEADDTISKEDLFAKYNECAELFNELDGALVKNGTYDVEAEVKSDMDYIYELLGAAEVVVQSEDLSDEEAVSVYGELQTNVDLMIEFKNTYI